MAAAADGPRSKAEVEKILNELESPSDGASPEDREVLLKQLHAATRTLGEAVLEPLFSKRGVRILGRYGFQDSPTVEHGPALRCLNNVLVRSPESRKAVYSEIGLQRMVATLKRDDPEDELALSNIFIFSCHGASIDLGESFESSELAETINAVVVRHAKEGSLPTAELTSACSASLRLLSTLAASWESYAEKFLDSIDPVLDMLSRVNVPTPPLQPPVSTLVHCLPVLPLQKKEEISPKAVDKLVEILEDCIKCYATQDKESEFLPLLLALSHISRSEAAEAKARLAENLIPSDEDRKEALGKGSTLPHKLLHMSNMSMFPEVREIIMTMYFELSGKDPSKFVHNVGFGNAAGYLSSQGIEISQQDLGSAIGGGDVNPITGQKVEAEPQDELPEMTQEEKEREAERLFVLFERLKATGVVDVENPVTQAMRSGTIEELPDDSDDEDGTSKKP